MVLILLLYFAIAATFIFGKLLLSFVPPIFLIAIRMIISGIGLLIAYLIFSKKPEFRRSKDYLFLLGVAIFHILIPFTTEYMALQTINPSGVCLFYNLSPLFSAFFSYLFFKETMTGKKWMGIFISLLGILYFTAPHIFTSPDSFFVAPSFDHILMFISVLTASLGWILVRILVKNRGFSPLFVNGIGMLLGGITALPFSHLLEGRVNIFEIENKGYFFFLLTSLILLANVLFYNLYSYLLKRYTTTILSFFGLLTPLFVAMLESIFLEMTISPSFFISTFVISFGIYIFYQEEIYQGYISR